MQSESSPKTYSLVLRLRRVTVEDAYVAVPVTNAVLKQHDDGTLRIDMEKFVAEAVALSSDPEVNWQVESAVTEPHEMQGPVPEGRILFDGIKRLTEKKTAQPGATDNPDSAQ